MNGLYAGLAIFAVFGLAVYTSDRWVPIAFPEENNQTPGTSTFDTAIIAVEIHELVNHERQSRNLQTVSYDSTLERASTEYAKIMIRDNFFDHTAPDGTTVNSLAADMGFTCFQAPYYGVADNLAQGGSYYGQNSEQRIASQTVSGWMGSEGHRANILTPSHDEMGLGIAFDGDIAYIVLSFC